MKNKIRRNIFGFIIGAIIVSITTVYAATKIYASSISIDTTNISDLAAGATLDTAITGLYDRLDSTECPDGYKCYVPFSPQVGDYVKMTPTLTSFTTDTTYTEYSSTQTINPSELNLWRVIQINDDGTIDMVSEYVSSTAIYFAGRTGYKNLVGYLNVLANKYENSNYTVGSRYMGYNGQTEYLTDTASTVDSTSTTIPWKSSTGSSTVESQGGGDTLYTKDTNLVKNVLGTLKAYRAGIKTASSYWLASRYYSWETTTYWYYSGRNIDTSGSLTDYYLYRYNSGFNGASYSRCLRPIVTLKSEIYGVEGSGTSSDPWVLP